MSAVSFLTDALRFAVAESHAFFIFSVNFSSPVPASSCFCLACQQHITGSEEHCNAMNVVMQ